MQKIIFILFLIFSASYSIAQPKNEIPLYGSQPKSSEEIKADEKFIADAVKAAGSRPKAYQEMLKRGWTAVSKGAAVEAIKRFNQAYLLFPNDYQAYWGLGIASSMNNKHDESIVLFEKGYKLNSKIPRFLADYGFALVGKALSLPRKLESEKMIMELFMTAEKKYNEALKIDPKFALPYFRLAVLDYYRGDFNAAWKNIDLCKAHGGEGLDPRFLSDLKKASPR